MAGLLQFPYIRGMRRHDNDNLPSTRPWGVFAVFVLLSALANYLFVPF